MFVEGGAVGHKAFDGRHIHAAWVFIQPNKTERRASEKQAVIQRAVHHLAGLSQSGDFDRHGIHRLQLLVPVIGESRVANDARLRRHIHDGPHLACAKVVRLVRMIGV